MKKKRNKKYKLKKFSIKRDAFQENNLSTKDYLVDKIVEPASSTIDNKDTENMANISIEAWKIQKKINKIKNSHSDLIVWLDYSIQKIQEILQTYNIKVIDYTGHKYIEGMNWIEIVSVEKDEAQEYPVILDVIVPMIELDWSVYKKSKVIVLSS